jgi:pSer/pThr/pTyr-binding forkhead associated (FHA) protein
VLIAVDASLRDPDGPEAPVDFAPVTLTLDKPANLIGRKSEKRAINPELALEADDGVSHRHAILTRGADGSLILRDIGSSNGTRLNGADVKPLEDIVLKDGDQITLGRWTRITVNCV